MIKLSRKSKMVNTSLARELFDKALKCDDTIDLTLGDPDIETQMQIKYEACKAIKAGKTRYSANAGLVELRKQIAKVFRKDRGVEVNEEDEIIITVGGMESLFLTVASLVDENDEVIIIGPYYPNYINMVMMCGGIPIIIETTERNGFLPTRHQLEEKITDKTVSIIINSPNNPTGVVYSEEVLAMVADISIKNDLSVISDEVYRTLVFNNKVCKSIVEIDGMKERTVIIDSCSKQFAMTGYRLGYAVGPSEIIECMTKLQENIVACAPLMSQYAAIEAYANWSEDKRICDEYEIRRKLFIESINKIEGVFCFKSDATFYVFVNVSGLGLSGKEFAYELLKEEHIAVVPGEAYGEAYSEYIRVALTANIDSLLEAVRRIKKFVEYRLRESN